MPGVAHVKRCDQCRQSKKKCDQVEPVCGRCERLGLRCGGAVVKRFKFIPEKFERTPNAVVARNNREKCERMRSELVIVQTPPSESMRVARGFISVLEGPSVSYDLNLFGVFFKTLPQRFDSSPALRSSVNALTDMYRSTRGHGDSTLALRHQGTAMKDIRAALQNPEEAHTPNTVLAIYVVMMSQYLLYEISLPSVPHLQVMAYLLNDAMKKGWIKDFNKDMLLCFYFGIMWEAMANNEMTLDPEFLESLAPFIIPIPPGTTEQDLDRSPGLYSLGRMPRWLSNPILYHKQISEAYDMYLAILPTLRKGVATARAAREVPNAPVDARKALSRALVQLSMFTVVCALLNKAARRVNGRDGKLVAQMTDFCSDIVMMAKLSDEFKPIASASMPEAIIDVWGVMDPGPEKDSLEVALWEYCGQNTPKWLARAKKLAWCMEEQYLLSLEVAKLKI
ncbi:hypothetical protein N0V84_004238 [Fusarium piperis]|uniref:Zn(2)-C6 fungal-type domain-containing protein n=1 Tax=Fusarium piperis TaxID=1435070 RepID=A0A9W8WFV4_9HYPO|nr:hypothetical protein N0V84_004238 [Fusarium piperis]